MRINIGIDLDCVFIRIVLDCVLGWMQEYYIRVIRMNSTFTGTGIYGVIVGMSLRSVVLRVVRMDI